MQSWETLHQLAQNYPGLRPYIAANPRTYPASWSGWEPWVTPRSTQPWPLATASPSQHRRRSRRSHRRSWRWSRPRRPAQRAVGQVLRGPHAGDPAPFAPARSAFSVPRGLRHQLEERRERTERLQRGRREHAGRQLQAAGDPTVSVPTSHPAQAMASQSPARPVQPALQQTFQQSANVSQAQSLVIPAASQQAPAVAGDDGVFGVGTEDDDSEPQVLQWC